MFERLGRLAVRYHTPIVFGWIGVAILITLLAPNINDVASSDQADFLPANAPFQKAEEIFRTNFPSQYARGSTVIVVDASQNEGVYDPAVWGFIRELEQWLTSEDAPDNIIRVSAPTTNELVEKLTVADDQQIAIVVVDLSTGHVDPHTGDTIHAINDWLDAHTPAVVEVHQTGSSPVVIETDESIRTSVDRTIWVTVALVVILLLTIYRSPVSPLIPLATVTISYFITRGLVAWVGDHVMTITSYVNVLLVVILYGAGTDYCLFLISRFREEMADQKDVTKATRHTVQLVGETITSSAGTIFVGFMAMSLAEMGLFKTPGPALAIGVLVRLAAGVTLTPALLATLGERAFWPGKAQHRATGHWYEWVSKQVSSRPVITIALIIAMMAPFSIYAVTLDYSYDAVKDLPDDKPAVVGFNVLGEHMDQGLITPMDVTITNRDPETMAADIARLTDELAALDGVGQVRGMNSPFGQGEDLDGLLRPDVQIEAIRAQLGETDLLTADPAEVVTLLQSMAAYLDVLGERFPAIADDENYAAMQSTLTQLGGLLRVDGQLMLAANALAQPLDVTKIDPALVPLVQPAAQGYLKLLGERFPAIADDPSYVTLNEIAETGLPALLTRKDDLVEALNGLAARFAAMDEATLPISDLMTLVEPAQPQLEALAGDRVAKVDSTLAGLAARFRTMPDAYLLPTEAGDLFARLDPIFERYLADNGNAYRLEVILDVIPTSYQAMETITDIRDILKGYEGSGEAQISGDPVMVTDIHDTMNRDQVKAFGFVMGGIFLVLLLMLQSVIAPLYLIATVVLSFTFTLGLTGLFFDVVLGIEKLTFWMPFFTFVFLVALGIDYSIFLMGRVKEEVGKHGPREGVHRAVAATGSIITSAGIILAGTFAAMTTGEIKGLSQIGFAVSVGVLIDTFVVRTMLVPALTALLGRWTWWPGGLPRGKQPTVPSEAGD